MNLEVEPADGSTLAYTQRYRAFIEQFCIEHGIASVLDAGCGDWTFMQAIDWRRVRYVGMDLDPAMVERNRARFPGVEFIVGDVRDLSGHAGFDLLIVKDVLQHWSHRSIHAFLDQAALARFRHVLLVNCDDEGDAPADIPDGEWRPLNLMSAPFSLGARGARPVFRFATKRVIHLGPRLRTSDIFERFEWWVINLDRRPDRLAHALGALDRVGARGMRRFPAFDGSRLQLTSKCPGWVRKGAVGCYLSHLALLKQAHARRAPCVVTEDDMVFADDFPAAFDAFVREVPEDWDVLHLPGHDHCKPPEPRGEHHVRLVATWGTSFSVLRLPAIDRLVEEADLLDRPIDDFYIRMMSSLKFYSPARKLVWQERALGTNIGDHG